MEKAYFPESPKNISLVEEALNEILREFNWDVFYEIIERHQRKSGKEVLTKKEKEENLVLGRKLKTDLFNITGLEPTFNETIHPEIIIDNTIDSIANATTWLGPRGTIKINLTKFAEYFNLVVLNFRKENISPDKEILKICILKILLHELVHLFGGVKNDQIFGNYSSINEAITELLSFNIMNEYMNSTGNRLKKEIVDSYYKNIFYIYENEKSVFSIFVLILINTENQTSRAIVDAFYWAHINRYSVSSSEFIDLLPEKIQLIWIRFLRLDMNRSNYEDEMKELYLDLEKAFKD
jgi:hypothetical protein